MKMFETVAVLIVFFFLLILSSVFYFWAQNSALEKEKNRANEQYAFQIVLKSLYLPELDCSFLVTQRDNCIDIIKLEKLAKSIKLNENVSRDYFKEFGYVTINVTEVFPERTNWILYENIPTKTERAGGQEKEIPSYTEKRVTQSPILLYDAWHKTYAFGVIEVSVYAE